MSGTRKVQMHLIGTVANVTIALMVTIGACVTGEGQALLALVGSTVAQGIVTGGTVAANASEHRSQAQANTAS